MKIMARRKLLYGVLYSAGDVFECGDVEQVRAWVATGAVGLMGAALPERVETQAQGEMAVTLEPTSAVLKQSCRNALSRLKSSWDLPAQRRHRRKARRWQRVRTNRR